MHIPMLIHCHIGSCNAVQCVYTGLRQTENVSTVFQGQCFDTFHARDLVPLTLCSKQIPMEDVISRMEH